MGCGCGGRVRTVRSISSRSGKGFNVQTVQKKKKSFIQQKKLTAKTCPRCKSTMNGVSRYVVKHKKVVKLWICNNKTCRYKIKK